ncbi:MAG: signal peptidase II [Chloroflexi bacterium RBG_13_51_18]|nr:MAG: signal peptidase II [Chloroflexi bacterium RBG_13_51_18]
MEKLHLHQDKWRDIVFGSVVLFVVIIDQLTKALIRANLALGEVSFDAGIFRIIHIQNTGAAFGIFKDHSLTLIITSIIGIVVILILVFLLRSRWHFLESMWVRVGMALVMGGTIGNNLIDRIRQGYVTDFIDFKIWPAWNVADASITIGVIIIAYRLIFYSGTLKSKV